MKKEDYELIAQSIWRSSAFLQSMEKNKVRRQAKRSMAQLIASDLIGSLRQRRNFDEEKFLKDCGIYQ